MWRNFRVISRIILEKSSLFHPFVLDVMLCIDSSSLLLFLLDKLSVATGTGFVVASAVLQKEIDSGFGVRTLMFGQADAYNGNLGSVPVARYSKA
jgi:hypothetical protein